jgi:hypothetical protein
MKPLTWCDLLRDDSLEHVAPRRKAVTGEGDPSQVERRQLGDDLHRELAPQPVVVGDGGHLGLHEIAHALADGALVIGQAGADVVEVAVGDGERLGAVLGAYDRGQVPSDIGSY